MIWAEAEADAEGWLLVEVGAEVWLLAEAEVLMAGMSYCVDGGS